MNVLVLNARIKSLEFDLHRMPDEEILISGKADKIGSEHSVFSVERKGAKRESFLKKTVSHEDALAAVAGVLEAAGFKPSDISAVGHRVVHGGVFTDSAMISEVVKKEIYRDFDIAPLHNPYNLRVIEAAQNIYAGVPHVAVFDTAFHATLPETAYRYPLPERLYHEYKIRRYGFHGPAHKYLVEKTAGFLRKKTHELDMITFFMGAGCSAAAIKGGKSVDTSMGFTPLEGLMMSTRSGDVSAGIIIFLLKNGWTIKELERTLNHESGLLGVSGESEDLKEVLEHSRAGDPKSRLAVDMYVYRARKYLGAYWLGLPDLAAVSLTGDIAEEIPYIRERIFENLGNFGLEISKERNDACVATAAEILSDEPRVKVFVIPRSGDLLIARETYAVVRGSGENRK